MFTALLVSLCPIQAPAIEWSTVEADFGGETVALRRGQLAVPERYDGPSRILKLPVLVAPAREGAMGPPIVFLHGGPGGSAVGSGSSPIGTALFSPLRDFGDVVLFDQRGGFRTSLPVFAPLSGPFPTDILESEEKFRAGFVNEARAAAKFIEGKADLSAYTTVENAKDLDVLRQALGVEKIVIVAHSYGTHLAQAYLRQFPDRVASAVLMGTEGVGMTMKLPSTYRKQIDNLSRLITAHPNTKDDVPDFADLFERTVEKLDREPLIAVHDDKEYKIGGFGLMWLLRFDIGDTADLPQFPRIVHAAFHGDVEPLMPMFRKRFGQVSRGFPVVTLVMDEASGVSPARAKLIAEQSDGFFFAPVVNMGLDALGKELGGALLGPEFRQPVRTDVPTLFLSGTLDSNTPPSQAEAVRKGFSNSWHIVIENAGHEDFWRTPAAVDEIVSFVRSGQSSDTTITKPVPNFRRVKRRQ